MNKIISKTIMAASRNPVDLENQRNQRVVLFWYEERRKDVSVEV